MIHVEELHAAEVDKMLRKPETSRRSLRVRGDACEHG
jgi:hypothetical protein